MKDKDKGTTKKETKKDYASPYQELYGIKKSGEDGPRTKGEPLKDAGAFGSAAISPGPEPESLSGVGEGNFEQDSPKDNQGNPNE